MEATDKKVPGPYLTLRVSRDSGRTWGPKVTYEPAREAPPIESPARFPLCRCPKCGPLT
jgi:hypothetical protein